MEISGKTGMGTNKGSLLEVFLNSDKTPFSSIKKRLLGVIKIPFYTRNPSLTQKILL
jgi:hypothetical protein